MRAPAIGSRLAALMLAWLAGVAVQLQERSLPVAFALRRRGHGRRGRAHRRLRLAPARACRGHPGEHGRAARRSCPDRRAGLASARRRVGPALEGRDLVVTGVVASLPQAGPNGLRFRFALDAESRRHEREQVALLVVEHGSGLQSDVLIAPHHGSKTSSSAALFDAVRPSLVVIQAGYRNRFGHPAAEVLGRYRERGIRIVDSPECGARSWPAEAAVDDATCQREAARRSWRAGEASVAP